MESIKAASMKAKKLIKKKQYVAAIGIPLKRDQRREIERAAQQAGETIAEFVRQAIFWRITKSSDKVKRSERAA
jgi:uncharacterized protein (DUF1778 family)